MKYAGTCIVRYYAAVKQGKIIDIANTQPEFLATAPHYAYMYKPARKFKETQPIFSIILRGRKAAASLRPEESR